MILPTYPQWRVWKFWDGKSMHKAKRKLYSVEDVQYYMKKYGAVDVYYSPCCWLNPERVKARSQRGMLTDSLFLFGEWCIDIDSKNPANAVNQLKDCLYLLKGKAEYVKFTGSKGYGIQARTWFSPPEHPKERELAWELLIQSKTKKIKASVPGIDMSIENSRAVWRVVGSTNSKSGRKCEVIDSLALIYKSASAGERDHVLDTDSDDHRDSELLSYVSKQHEGEFTPANSPLKATLFLESTVFGTQLHTFIGCFSQLSTRMARNIVNKYDLPYLAIYSFGDVYYGFSPKAGQKRWLQNILQREGCLNESAFRKFSNAVLPIATKDTKGNSGTFKFKAIVVNSKDTPCSYSSPHCKFLGLPQLPYTKVGKGVRRKLKRYILREASHDLG